MLKKIFLFVLCILFIVGGSIHDHYLSDTCAQLTELLAQAEAALSGGHYQDAHTLFSQFRHKWQQAQALFATFLPHAQIDEVQQQLDILTFHLDTKSYDDAAEEIRSLSGLLYQLYESNTFSWRNIL